MTNTITPIQVAEHLNFSIDPILQQLAHDIADAINSDDYTGAEGTFQLVADLMPANTKEIVALWQAMHFAGIVDELGALTLSDSDDDTSTRISNAAYATLLEVISILN